MTAYAYRDGILAVDSLCQRSGLRSCRMHKVVILPDGDMIVGAGQTDTIRHVAKQLLAGVKPIDVVGFKDDDPTYVHRIKPDGHVDGWCSEGYHFDDSALFIGNGEYRFLSGAMAVGASAIEAVIAACWHSVDCDFPIQVYQRGEWVRTITSQEPEAQNLRPVFPEMHLSGDPSDKL